MKKLTTDEFLNKLPAENFLKFDYSKFICDGIENKSIIICLKHGEFLQTPHNHLHNSAGCPKCKFENLPQCQPKPNSAFIKEATTIHGDIYSYDCSEYIGLQHMVDIRCKLHGIFSQLAQNHLTGHGCPICAIQRTVNKLTYSTEEFIQKATEIHGYLYEYTNVKYTQHDVEVEIICKIHGSFWQKPENHLSGCGCKKCISIISKPEIEFLNHCSIPDNKEHRQFKIGRKSVDGYDSETNTIYEFLGDYWHGNPIKYKSTGIHPIVKITYGELYNKTFDKFKTLNSLGYNIKYIWEIDWKNYKKGIDKEPKIINY